MRLVLRLLRIFLFVTGDQKSVMSSEERNGDVHENGTSSLHEEVVLLDAGRQLRASQLRHRGENQDSSQVRYHLQICY